MPMTMPASPVTISSSSRRRVATDCEPVSRATRVAIVSAAELALATERAEQLGDRPEVLGREDLGRSQERRLSAGVHDPEHGPQGDHRLAAAHVALEQPVHRVVVGQVALDLGRDGALARVSG